MSTAIRFDRYGPPDVLEVVEVERPVPGPGQVLVRVKAAGINLGEAKIREGLFHEVLNEPSWKDIVDPMARWILAHAG